LFLNPFHPKKSLILNRKKERT